MRGEIRDQIKEFGAVHSFVQPFGHAGDFDLLSLVNVGADILAEGLAYRASDIDVIWTSGYGFPRSRGGPMHYADSLGLGDVVTRIQSLAATGGGDYWKVSPLLLDLARTGRTFADYDRERQSAA